MKLSRKKTFILVVVILVTTFCWLLYNEFVPRAFDNPLPKRDIVFELSGSAGFMDADGSKLVVLEYVNADVNLPRWLGEHGEYILFRGHPWVLQYATGNGYVHRARRIPVVDSAPVSGTRDVIVSMPAEDGREFVLTKVNTKTDQVGEAYMRITAGTFSLGSNPTFEDQLVVSLGYRDEDNNRLKTELVLYDTTTKTQRVLVSYKIQNSEAESFIERPAFSPDGKWIAYTTASGIYLIRPDGSENHLLVNVEGWYTGSLNSEPPSASFSPDSQWIVYHRCPVSGCPDWGIVLGKIYKMNIGTKEEVFLTEGGNPYWRLIDAE